MRKARLIIIICLALLAPAVSLQAETFRYDSHGKRDPMVPLVGQDKPGGGVPMLSEVAAIDDIRLEGIVGKADGSMSAIINGELVKENFRSGEVQIKKIAKRSVTLDIGGKEYTVSLSEEGGQKQ